MPSCLVCGGDTDLVESVPTSYGYVEMVACVEAGQRLLEEGYSEHWSQHKDQSEMLRVGDGPWFR